LVRASSKREGLEAAGAECVVASLESGEGLEEAVAGCDAVVHCAGIVKARRPSEFEQVNAGGSANLIQACLKSTPNLQRFIQISSLEAQGPSPSPSEDRSRAEPRPVTHYGKSKLSAERHVLSAKEKFPVTILRPTAIYGPRDIEMYAFFKSVARGLMPLMGGGDNRVTVVYGPDAAKAVLATLTTSHPSGEIHYLADGKSYTWKEMGETLLQVMGKRHALRLPLPVWFFKFAALFSEAYGKLSGQAVMLTRDKVNALEGHWLCDPESLTQSIGWKPETDFAAGSKLTTDWYRESGWL